MDNQELASSVEVADSRVKEIVQSVRVEVDGEQITLEEAILDLVTAHAEIEQYKIGSLLLAETIESRSREAKAKENEEIAVVLDEVYESSMDVYRRIKEGENDGAED